MPKEHLNPRELPNVVGPGDLARQAEHAFGNLSTALQAAGATPDDVVRLGIYVKNLRPEDGAVIRKALRRVFVRDTLPASTWLGVTSLALDELLIEVEATAVVE